MSATLEVQAHTPHIGRYAVEAKLGEGGMAETWLCRLEGARGFTRRVVVKTLRRHQQTDDFHTMLADEAQIGAVLDHPNIARVLELGHGPLGPFLVQEYVAGPNVAQILARQAQTGRRDARMAARIVSSIASALDYACHAPDDAGRPRKVIHRDVSPSNILVSRRGVPKLIDFGVAVFEGRESRTEVGVLKGKLKYMAPETLMNGAVTHQGDVYSLGIVLFCLCCGEDRWKGPLSVEALSSAGLDPLLTNILRRCLHPDPAQRMAKARELQLSLDLWLSEQGDRVEDEEVAAWLQALFPEGEAGWRAPGLSSDSSAISLASGSLSSRVAVGSPAGPRLSWRWMVGGAALMLVLSVSSALASATALWLALHP